MDLLQLSLSITVFQFEFFISACREKRDTEGKLCVCFFNLILFLFLGRKCWGVFPLKHVSYVAFASLLSCGKMRYISFALFCEK